MMRCDVRVLLQVLIHDLDLVVVDPQGRMHFGNGPSS
jgi:hypothetical protein